MDLSVVAKDITRTDLLHLYYYLQLTRTLENRITALYRQGRIVGGVYTSHGMEAIAVGYAFALQSQDVIAPYHRDMGAFLIRGITPGEVIAQYLGKRTGPSKGKDGNVHIGDLKRGVIGFVSHLADNLPVATGAALAFQIRGDPHVVVTNTGDGGTSRGDFHEAMNFAAVRKLPVVFFCNNNQYAYSTPVRNQMAVANVADRATGYGMINEAIFALEDGVAPAEAIDLAMTAGTNHPVGPLALADRIGLDTVLAICEVLHQDLGDPKFRPCPLLRRYVEIGRLGKKSGRGFYGYTEAGAQTASHAGHAEAGA